MPYVDSRLQCSTNDFRLHLIDMCCLLFLCTDPDTIISELNNNELFYRPKLIDTPRSAISVGSNYRIERNGVIKEWKFFSAKAGMVIFQVWRRHVSEYPDM